MTDEKELIVFKIGGSVAKKARDIINEIRECNINALIVPGGWIFAELIRKLNIDNTTAHWMAIKAMDLYGIYLGRFAKIIEPEDFNFKVEGVNVILPYKLTKKYDELPHTWDITSDAIAVWIASKMNLNVRRVKRVVKITNVDGIIKDGKLVEEIKARDLKEKTCIDLFAPKIAMENGIEIFICNGMKSGRVKDYILHGRAVGTIIRR